MLILWRRRDCDSTITILESDGSNYAYAAGDVIRLKFGRESSSAPVLDLSSKAASVNGSTVSKTNPCLLALRADDTALLKRGFYSLEISVVDDSDNDKIKHVDSQVVFVHESQAGGVSV